MPESKSWTNRNYYGKAGDFVCEACGQNSERTAPNQRVCKICVPNAQWYRSFYRPYGLTKPMFDDLYEKQSGLCDLCELPLGEMIRVDHCHKQGHVRGLLHNKCNIGLHYIEDDKFFSAAIRYIERHRL